MTINDETTRFFYRRTIPLDTFDKNKPLAQFASAGIKGTFGCLNHRRIDNSIEFTFAFYLNQAAYFDDLKTSKI